MTLAEIRKRLREWEAEATPGPYTLVAGMHGSFVVHDGNGMCIADTLTQDSHPTGTDRLMVESRNHLPALLDALDEAEKALELAEGHLRIMHDRHADAALRIGKPGEDCTAANVCRAALARLRGGA